MKVFGYIITKKEILGHGMPWWDEYYEEEVKTTIETRIFESKNRRDEEKEKSLKKYRNEYSGYLAPTIESFSFESEIEQ